MQHAFQVLSDVVIEVHKDGRSLQRNFVEADHLHFVDDQFNAQFCRLPERLLLQIIQLHASSSCTLKIQRMVDNVIFASKGSIQLQLEAFNADKHACQILESHAIWVELLKSLTTFGTKATVDEVISIR